MGCNDKLNQNNCIANTLLAITEAQERVCEAEICNSGCEAAIDELLGNVIQTSNYNTVPFLLTCQANCQPFIGYGARRATPGPREFGTAAVFRVTDVDPETNCAVIEFLQFMPINSETEDLNDHLTAATTNLSRTGVCMTVNLDDFSCISCLPAVNL